MRRIIIGMVIIILALGGYYLFNKQAKDVVPAKAGIQESETGSPIKSGMTEEEAPTIDSTTDLYLETQKLTPADYSKDYTELKDQTNNF